MKHSLWFFSVYRFLTYLFLPFIWIYIWIRKKNGKEDIARFNERLGKNHIKRPKGRLVWMHGASVGETRSMFPLINKILEENKDITLLITSGTKTSAEILGRTLPKRSFHQYVPIDCYPYVRSFINYFKPDVAIWFESEFWPNLMKSAYDCGTKMILLNGRISDRSFSRWKLCGDVIKQILSLFDVIIAQSRESKLRLEDLSGGRNVDYFGNIKFSALENMTIDVTSAKELEGCFGNRHVFLASSTHSGEEEMIARVHLSLKNEFPDILTIIIPRHANRSEKIQEILSLSNVKYKVRSKREAISDDTDIYLADTMGETALFYSLCRVVFIGGSLVKFGGQNMIEPMSFSDAVLVGPYTFNFRDMVADAIETGALIEVPDEYSLANKVSILFKDDIKRTEYQKNAVKFASASKCVCDNVYKRIEYIINEVS